MWLIATLVDNVIMEQESLGKDMPSQGWGSILPLRDKNPGCKEGKEKCNHK